MNTNPLKRFSDRVENYVKYRPRYPRAMIDRLVALGVVHPGDAVADIGSGTGFSSELFLQAGCQVWGVEPNKEMREAGETLLASYKEFHSLEGTAERTTLPDASMDMAVAGQAFHWFDRAAFKSECARILKPGRNVVLFWNDRQNKTTEFLRAYESLLEKFGTDYKEVNHRHVGDAEFDLLWGRGQWRTFSVEASQSFDFTGLKGRLLSSPYAPLEGHPSHRPMLEALKQLFARFEVNGKVNFEYDTRVYNGVLPVAGSR